MKLPLASKLLDDALLVIGELRRELRAAGEKIHARHGRVYEITNGREITFDECPHADCRSIRRLLETNHGQNHGT